MASDGVQLAGVGIQLVPQALALGAQATTPVSLTAANAYNYYSNEGATAIIVFNLPAAVAGVGPYTFIVQDADGIRVVAATGDTIRIAADVSTSAGNISSTTIGSVVTIVCLNGTEWMATSIVGTWAAA